MVDALLRATIDFIHEGVDYEALFASQKEDSEVQAYHTALSSLWLEDIPFGNKGNSILSDTSTGQPRPVVHTGWRWRIFDTIGRSFFVGYKFRGPIFREIKFRESVHRALPHLHN